ncbi:MAG: eIF3 subunit 6 N terminal domain-containing protein [Piptocephalis tieghemiana]|nr:MAG: eIF3 subunit 6 N terminal domain-containing protein [Piptocephalis tieghemiana]
MSSVQPVTNDLTRKMIPYFDRHLIYPLLHFLSLKELYPKEDLLNAKYDLLVKTGLTEFAGSIYKEMHGESAVSDELKAKEAEILQLDETLRGDTEKVLDIIGNPEVIASLGQDKLQNQTFLERDYGLTQEMLLSLYKYGRYQYELGQYGACADLLYHYRILSTNAELSYNALWGKFASEILSGNWDVAYQDLHLLRESIESRVFENPLHQLQQRTWLIHWSLFVFFNHAKGRDGIIDLFFQAPYINTIQTSCPWILRYLATAVITNRRRKNYIKELVRVIQQESHAHSDPIIEFILALYVHFDFDGAQKKLLECATVLENDFFLLATFDDFIESARCVLTETYCRIHKKVEIGDLTTRLNMQGVEGEKWVVNLIRDTRVDAKIDFADNTVNLGSSYPTVYQQIIERTKNLAFRSQVLATKIDKRLSAQKKAAAAAENASSVATGALASMVE